MRSDGEMNMYTIINLMQRAKGATVLEICKALECDRHTFYVQKKRMDQFGIPLYSKDDYSGNTNSKRWFIDPEWSNSTPVVLEPHDRLLLRMLLSRTRLFESSETKKMIQVIKQKIERSLLGDKKTRIKTTYSNFKGIKNYSGKEKIMEILMDCLETRHLATVTYQAAQSNELKTYDIEPYTLVEHGNSLYVIVAITKHNRNIRILAVDRILDLKKHATERFDYPEGFDPDAYLNLSFGIFIEEPIRVIVRFSADTAIYARERTWGTDQTEEITEDHSLILSFTAAGKDEIKRWILSFGPSAQVLNPPELIESVKKDLQEANLLYI